MNLTISKKITSTIVASIITTALFIVIFAYNSISNGYNELIDEDVKTSNNVTEHQLSLLETNFLHIAQGQAIRPSVIKGIRERNTALLQELGAAFINTGSSDIVVFTDDKGDVIARGHTKKHGDNIINQVGIKIALTGKAIVTFESGNVVKFGSRAYAPIADDGKIIGCVILGQDMTKNYDFVDSIKGMTGAEVTLFYGKLRVTTTLEQDGKRLVGTTLDNETIIKTVLDEGKSYFGENVLFGKTYKTAYIPLKSNNKVVGIIFTGLGIDGILASIRHTITIVAVSAGACLLIFGAIAYVISRRISKPVERCTAFAEEVSNGVLDKKLVISTKDETKDLADSLNVLVANMKRALDEANEAKSLAEAESQRAQEQTKKAEDALVAAERSKREGVLQAAEKLEGIVHVLTSASDELNGQIQGANAGSDHQAQRIGETATAMEEMNSTVLEVASLSSHAAETADNAKQKAQNGASVVSKVIDGIVEVQTKALSLKEDMTSLGTQADNIGQILNVISDIADQTNLLALNAAIEAARAGEAGRGFAVVADEVRKLAEKTMTATKEVGEAINGIQQGTRKNIDNVDQSVVRIDEATALARDSGATLRDIVEYVDSTTDQVRSIATASEQQSATSEEINRSIDDINRIAVETSEIMNQSSHAVEELANQARILTNMIKEMQSEGAEGAGGAIKSLPA